MLQGDITAHHRKGKPTVESPVPVQINNSLPDIIEIALAKRDNVPHTVECYQRLILNIFTLMTFSI